MILISKRLRCTKQWSCSWAAVLLVLQWMFDVGFWTQNLWNAYVTILLLGLRGDWSWHLGGENLQITLHIYCTGKKQQYISVVQCRTATHWNSSASSTTQHRAELSNQSSHHQLRIINICKLLGWIGLLHTIYCIYSRSQARGSTEHSQRKTFRFQTSWNKDDPNPPPQEGELARVLMTLFKWTINWKLSAADEVKEKQRMRLVSQNSATLNLKSSARPKKKNTIHRFYDSVTVLKILKCNSKRSE